MSYKDYRAGLFQMAACLSPLQNAEYRVNQRSGRFRTEFHSDPGPGALGLIYKIDIQCMFHRCIEGVVIGYTGPV